jgi:anaerobic dimethyl sulfoxide reductase subunit A
MSNDSISHTESGVKIIRTTSTFDCGGRCPIRLHVKDNRIIRIEGDDVGEPEQLRTCLRGEMRLRNEVEVEMRSDHGE